MSSLKDKMYNYEVTPPADVWEKIKLSLNEETNEFPDKLRQYEVKPPVRVWEKINSALDTEQNISVRRIRRIPSLFKYAAAAVLLIGLITFGVIKFTSKTSGENEVAEKEKIVLPTNSSVPSKIENNTSETASTITDQQRDDAALEESKKTYAKLDLSENTRRELRQALMKPVDLISSENSDRDPSVCFPDYIKSVLANSPRINTADRYIMLMTPEGNIIRVSKKWADLVCCVSGEDEADECKDQLTKWRQKIASSAVAPSPANFMDILNMVELLKDNNP